jgi:hypothetical protein
MRITADVTGGKPIAVLLQSISGVSAINPLVAVYDIHGGKRELLFFCFVPDITRDCPGHHTRLTKLIKLINYLVYNLSGGSGGSPMMFIEPNLYIYHRGLIPTKLPGTSHPNFQARAFLELTLLRILIY